MEEKFTATAIHYDQAAIEEHQKRLDGIRNEGRYGLGIAAHFIDSSSRDATLLMLDKLIQAAHTEKIPTYIRGSRQIYKKPLTESARSIEVSRDAYWDDLNEWLKIYEPRIVYRFPDPDAPAAKVDAVQGASPSGDDVEEQAADDHGHDETLAALFNPVPVEALEKMFPADGKWKSWAEKAASNGLIKARPKRGMFNPYKAGVWFIRKGAEGWSEARLNRTLANNLPARSRDEAYLLTGDLD